MHNVKNRRLAPAPLLAVAGGILLILYTLLLRYLEHYHYIDSLHDFWQPMAILALFLLFWGGINLLPTRPAWLADANRFLLPVAIFLIVFAVYYHFTRWLGWFTTLPQTYWDQLAVSFLHGKLYLENPTYFHDLTEYLGRWYVPVPPFPALLLIPVTLLLGADQVNAVAHSIFFAALNATLLFLVLEQLVKMGWIVLSRPGRLWLVALLAFGTPHLWVGMNGQMWFFSQTVTVTCILLAVLFALQARPAWLCGAMLALAVFSRPSTVMLWPFLLAIQVQQQQIRNPKLNWKSILSWSVASAIPMGLAGMVLLSYNYARFANPLDFGYTTLNGAEQIVQDARTYGLFNPHFIPRNLNTMFLLLPALQAQWPFLLPSREGMSILATTPAWLYLIRPQSFPLWKKGALLSILLCAGMLALYHNTGSYQFGFRYLLDFVVPLILLLAAGLGQKTPRLFAVLVVLSALIQVLGTVWFAAHW
jgi:hypothetical protein